MSSAIKPLILLVTVLLLATVMQCNAHCDGHWEHVIYVNDSGVNDSTCWDGSIPCNNLNQALTGIRVGNHTKNNTVVCIYAGRYKLYNKTENIIHYRSHIAIIGFVNSVVIECDTYTGLSFVRTDNITLRNLTLHGCGSVQSSTSKNFNPNHPSTKFLNITVAVYMLLCTDVLIDSVTVQHSNGVGMTMYNVLNASITHSCFDSNGLEYTNDMHGGGGGLQVEFAACFPEYNTCNSNYSGKVYQFDAWFIIKHTVFNNNTSVRMPNYLPYKLPNEDKTYYGFGRGGGVAIMFKGSTENKRVLMSDTKLVNNSAHYGGGFYIAYHDKTQNNSVMIENSCISNNFNPIRLSKSNLNNTDFRNSDGAGGGGKVIYAVARHPHYSKSNNITITDCTFYNNTGTVGGGFAIEAIFTNQKDSFDNTLVIKDSHFIKNVAFLGSGLYFSRSSSSSDFSPFLTTNISNITVEQSKTKCATPGRNFSTLPCSGTFYTNNYPVTLQSNITFVNNNATGLEVHSSILTIDENATIYFTSNRGEYGGAIGLYDCSYITLNKYTTLHFINNSAREWGGAIYSSRCTLNNQPTTLSSECFFQYYMYGKQPWNWTASLYFENNTCDNANDNAIYAYDVIPCWELIKNEAEKPFFEQLQSTFCWNKTWNYHDGNCSKHVDSPAAILEVQRDVVTITPGSSLPLPLRIYNGNGRIITDVDLIVCITGTASFSATENKKCQTTKLNENSLVIYKHHNDEILMATHFSSSSVIGEYVTLTVKTTDFAPYQVDFIAKFEPCKWPYTFNNAECVVDTNLFCCSGDFSCTNCNSNCSFNIAKYVQEKIGHCVSMGYDSNGTTVLVDGQCPWLYYNHKCSLVQETYEHCRDTREGRLCGKCTEGYSVAINSLYLECVPCKGWSTYKGWLILLAVEFLPLTVFILLVLVLKLDVSNGTVNGLILYCQVITLQLPGWFYPGWTALYWMPTDLSSITLLERLSEYKYLYVHAAAVTPLSIWNLNFLPLIPLPPNELPVCISDSLSPLGAILFWYLIAFYPLIILAVVSVWTILYLHKNYLLTITRPIHRKLARFWLRFNITPSLFTSAATIYILCFTQFTQTSMKLLNFTPYNGINGSASGMAFYYDGTLDYFGWYSHLLAGSLAVVVLFVIVILPVVCLLFYPFGWFQRILNGCKLNHQWLVSLADVFTGQFKNGLNGTKDFRYFAGLFFLFRVLAIVIFVSPYNSPGPVFILILQITLTVNAAGVIMIVRPYKENIHNLTNFFLLLYLAFLSGISYIQYAPLSLHNIMFKVLVVLTYVPIILGLLYAVCYILRKALKLYHVKYRSNSITRNTTTNFLPDRIVRPSKYKEHHVGVMPDDCRPGIADSNDDDQQCSSSEACPILSDESASQRQLLLPKEMQDVPLSTPTSDQTYTYGSIQ